MAETTPPPSLPEAPEPYDAFKRLGYFPPAEARTLAVEYEQRQHYRDDFRWLVDSYLHALADREALVAERDRLRHCATSANTRASRLWNQLQRAITPEALAALEAALDAEKKGHAVTHAAHCKATDWVAVLLDRLAAAERRAEEAERRLAEVTRHE